MSYAFLAILLFLPLLAMGGSDDGGGEEAEEEGTSEVETPVEGGNNTEEGGTASNFIENDNWSQEWVTNVVGSGEESHGHYVISTDDGGFLQVGETGEVPNSAKILAAKVDANGQEVWKQEFGQAGHNLGNAVLEVDDGYWIAGSLDQKSTLIKIDKENGETLAQNTVDLGGSNAIEHLIEHDDGIYAVGYRNATEANSTFFTGGEGMIMKFDQAGALQESKSLGDQLDQAYRIDAHGGDLIVSGLTEDAADYGVVTLDTSLETKWSKTFGGTKDDHNFAMDIGADGSIYLSGHTLSDTQNWDVLTMKLDSNGDMLWEKTAGNPRGFDARYIHDEAWDMKVLPDGDVLVVAGTGDEYANYSETKNGESSDTWRALLLRYSSSGDLLSQSVFGPKSGGLDWAGEALAIAPNGDVMLAVDNGSFAFLRLSSKTQAGS